MRIALLPSADLAYNSGSIIQAKRWFTYLHRQGHDAFLLGSRAPADIKEELRRFVSVAPEILNHPVIVDRPVSDEEIFVSLTASLAFLRTTQAGAPLDLVHAQYASFTSLAAAVFGAVTGTPFIVTSFGRDLAAVDAGHAPIRRMALASLSTAAAIVTANGETTASARALVGETVPVHEIPVSVDVDPILRGRVHSASWQAADTALIASVNSCFVEDKGIDLLLEALALLRPTTRFLCVVAGTDDHPQQVHRRRLEARVEALGMRELVRFPGYLSRDQVGGLLAAATVLVDARRSTNFSSVSVEALFAGCPVIATDTDATRMVIKADGNGLLFPAGDQRALAACIERALRPEVQSALRAGARRWHDMHGVRFREETCFATLLTRCEEIATRRTC
jgi:glycosyltransferase involved in cell wall biosynthesis